MSTPLPHLPSSYPYQHPFLTPERYEQLQALALKDPENFWGEQGKRLQWMTPYTRVKNTSYKMPHVSIKWYEDGTLNACANCIDRHLPANAQKTAILWEGDTPSEHRTISYAELYSEVSRFGNILRQLGVKKGDRVTIYMPMIPEAFYAMLACARVGAVHSVVFGGFSPESLARRIEDCGSSLVITADEGLRGGKPIPLKANVDQALEKVSGVKHVLVITRTGAQIPWNPKRDIRYEEKKKTVSENCSPEEMQAEDPLFILYTSGSTGKPKGVLHTTGGYLVYASLTHEMVFGLRDDDIFWCTADVGWITGHTYGVYGPLANGATVVMFEGVPNFPDPSRFWQIIDRFGVTIFYTAPTAIRALMGLGDSWVESTKRSSLRLLGTVGEPINPEAWNWYHRVVGEERCPIVDTWWQTETGAALITPLPGITPLKPGSATKPFFGIKPALVDAQGNIIEGEGSGNLVLLDSWPGQMRTVFGDHERFAKTYFSTYPGMYETGDGAKRDKDGDFWITGRVDDVLNVSGHRLGTAEIESALVAHPLVSEAAVVGYPHPIKGQGITCYVTLMNGITGDENLREELKKTVKIEIGPIAIPDIIQFAPALPKTRSGKIMRRILRKIAESDTENLGDISTLTDETVVAQLIAGHALLIKKP